MLWLASIVTSTPEETEKAELEASTFDNPLVVLNGSKFGSSNLLKSIEYAPFGTAGSISPDFSVISIKSSLISAAFGDLDFRFCLIQFNLCLSMG